MAYRELKGNIFNSDAMVIVNTVNCIGAMGKGIALEFKRRFPEMFKEYQNICEKKILHVGQIWPYKKQIPWVLNFAIKDDWHQPSKVEWIESTLQSFVANYNKMEIKSIAFPWMGAMNGGIPIETIKSIMRKHLQNLPDIDVEVYEFDPNVSGPLFENLKNIVNDPNLNINKLSMQSEIQSQYWKKIIDAMNENEIKSLYNLLEITINGKNLLGKTNIEKLYLFLSNYKNDKPQYTNIKKPTQLELF